MKKPNTSSQVILSEKPPSIPSHDFVYGYDYKDRQFVKQSNPDKKFTGEKEDKVGPGHY